MEVATWQGGRGGGSDGVPRGQSEAMLQCGKERREMVPTCAIMAPLSM
eukprot:CAMPEP_0118984920 /NCGR_PEP_ID=MMETSP1173-20130426/38762_1 /TAXON_ID=1034831 /ORGANISM="Rhizochromulina marina cf, Strain CCMP1243" /LENGTH=47 /DNA_ID= /DNA_START= /DNA_END= /DNA_ORIENTATION=